MHALETLATGYALIEGPRVDDQNRLYFSDVRRGGVFRRAPDGEIELVVAKRRGVGGIALHEDGGIVVSGRDICHVRDGESRVVFSPENVPSFNDIFVDAQGRVLAGSQRFDPFADPVKLLPGELYRIGPGGAGEMLYDDILLTNGIGFSPDGRRLYHSETFRNRVLVHDVGDDGACTNRRVLADMQRGGPDGLAVDEAGCVWVAAYGGGCVTRLTPEGKLDRDLEVPAKDVTSVCFGGPDRRDLYVVTADNTEDPERGGTVFRTRVEVPGLPVPKARV